MAEYKTELFLQIIRPFIQVLLLTGVWLMVFNLGNVTEIAGLTLPLFVMYIVVGRVVSYCHLDWQVYELLQEIIQSGAISLYLVRPMRLTLVCFVRIFGDAFVRFVLMIGIILAGNLLSLFEIPYFFPSITMFILFLLSFICAIILGFFMYYCNTLTMFWVGDNWSSWGVLDGIQKFASGEIIPLTISPLLFSVTSWLPFQYMMFTPVFIYLEKYTITEAFLQIGIQLLWIVAFAFLATFILKQGLKKMDSQGG